MKNVWRDDYDSGIEITAPYDDRKTFRLRSLTLTGILLSGKLPDKLSAMLEEEVKSGVVQDAVADLSGMEIAKLSEDYQRNIISEILVFPKLASKSASKLADDEITWDMLTVQDRNFILNTLDRPLDEWKRFPLQQSASLERVPNGKTSKQSAK